MRRRMRRGLFTATAALLLSGAAGCAPHGWSAAADVNPSEWAAGAEVIFPNTDTIARYDAALFLRCNDRFAEDTLTVRISVTTPDSMRGEELFLLAIPRTPSPAAIVREAAVPYRRRIHLGQEGDYRFTVTPTRPIRGVEAVGLTIRKDQ